MCPNCERPDCKHFTGGRSEAAYQDCIAHTAERANQMRDAIKRIHKTNPNCAKSRISFDVSRRATSWDHGVG